MCEVRLEGGVEQGGRALRVVDYYRGHGHVRRWRFQLCDETREGMSTGSDHKHTASWVARSKNS